MCKERKDFIRPTIRIDRDFYHMLKEKMNNSGVSFQELSLKLLEDWLEEKNK